MEAWVYQAALICADCAKAVFADLRARGTRAEMISDDHHMIKPIWAGSDGGGESDHPEHCDHCGAFLENPLTEDGERYVRQKVAEVSGLNPTVEQWRAFYSYLDLDDE